MKQRTPEEVFDRYGPGTLKTALNIANKFDIKEDEMKKALAEEPNMDAKKVIQKDMEIVKSWQNQLESINEDSEASKTAEDLLNYVEEAMSNAKDNIIKRLKYRFEDNVSYFGSEAEEKAEEIKTQVKNALINLADSIYEVIG